MCSLGAQTAKSVNKPPAVRSIRTGPAAPSHGRSSTNYPMQLGMQALFLELSVLQLPACLCVLLVQLSLCVLSWSAPCRTIRWAAPCGCLGPVLPTGCQPTRPPCSTRRLRRASLLPRQALISLANDPFSRCTSSQICSNEIQIPSWTAIQLPYASYLLLSKRQTPGLQKLHGALVLTTCSDALQMQDMSPRRWQNQMLYPTFYPPPGVRMYGDYSPPVMGYQPQPF